MNAFRSSPAHGSAYRMAARDFIGRRKARNTRENKCAPVRSSAVDVHATACDLRSLALRLLPVVRGNDFYRSRSFAYPESRGRGRSASSRLCARTADTSLGPAILYVFRPSVSRWLYYVIGPPAPIALTYRVRGRRCVQ